MIFIDFQKAFDSLEWNYLLICLEHFNFGPDFIRWVTTFSKNIQSCVINNGITSDYFTLQRGVRQGDPLSPYLFVIAAEVLAIAVRQNKEIKGISGSIRRKQDYFNTPMTRQQSSLTSTQPERFLNSLTIFRSYQA